MKLCRVILIALVSMAFGLSIASWIAYSAKANRERSAYFQKQDEALAKGGPAFAGAYCFPDRHPDLLIKIAILTGLTFATMWLVNSPLWSMPFSITSILMFLYWYWDTQRTIIGAEGFQFKGLDIYLYQASGFDVAVLLILAVLTSMQIVLLFQLIKKRFKGRKLP